MKRNTVFQIFLTISLLVVILTISLIAYINSLNKGFQKEILQSLEEVSNQGAVSIQTEINGKVNLLQDLATTIDIEENDAPDSLLAAVQSQLLPIAEHNEFQVMGVLTRDGTVYATNGEIYDGADQEFFQTAMEGNTTITGRVPISKEENAFVNIYSTPILDNTTGEPKAVLMAVYRTENFRATLEVKSFDGEGYSYLVEQNGNTVVDSAHATSFQDMSNIYTSIANADESNDACIEQLQYYLLHKENGSIIFRNRVDKYLYCTPVEINDWYLLTVVPVRIIDHQMNQVIRSTILLVIILVLVFAVLIWFILGQQKRRQEELMSLAYVDPVTGGYTFAKFQQLYEEILGSNSEKQFALLSLDLNHFKMINDLYGYEEGDRIIQNMDSLWRKLCRPNECCGHRNADRFVVLLTYENTEELEERLRNYRKLLQETTADRYQLSLRAGVYELEDTGEAFSVVFNRSMMAFSEAKNNGGHFYAFYHSGMEEQLLWEKYVEDYFQMALRKQEFAVYYQAKIDAGTGAVSGAEALVRWIRPDGTVIPPSRFIPILENNGTIAELDQYMFREVCLRQKAWLEEGKQVVPVSVNLSRVQLADRNFVDTYAEILENTGLPAKYVGLEFTESAMFDNEEILRDTVDRLHNMGIKVLIDDFGVGYSSMMTLKVIPVDILKMDKSFIDSIGDERGDKIVVGMIEFALSLGMSVTAEGVENDAQYRFLQSHRCNDIQGYYFSRPVPAGEYCRQFLGSA